MVGVPRSNGCRVCIKRRVKCDETRPACAKCQTYGVSCPGYEKAFKFVDRVHRRPQPSCDDKETSAQERSQTVTPALSSTDPSVSSSKTLMLLPSRSSASGLTATIHSPDIYQVQCLSTWIEDVSRRPSSVSDEITIARLFFLIPARLGTSSALDMAVRCLTVHHLGITRGNEEIVRQGRYAYGKALCNLQKAIYDPVEALTSETLCATMILSIYELFVCTKVDSWMKHAAGVRKIMQLRGPGSFQTDFDSAMMMAFKGVLIMEALFSGNACFLDSDEWRYVALQPPDDIFSAQFYEKTNELARCIAACPWLVKETYAIRSANTSEISTQVRVSALVHRTLEVYGRLQKWYEDFVAFAPSPEEVPSSTNDPLYPVIYRYWNSSTATTFCGYYATTTILHTILEECHHPAGDAGEISLAVNKICKSVEYLAGTGILGPYRLGFAMRIAFEMGTVATKLWIRKWLIRFEKFYRACSPNNYPPVEITTEDSSQLP